MRTPPGAARRPSAAAKRFYLFRELFAPPGPLAVFLALGRDDGGRSASDESLVLQTRRERFELGVELAELAAQLSAFLAQVDEAAKGHDDFTAVGEDRVCGAGSG